MTIEEQCDVVEKELHLARTTLLALQSRNADTDYDQRRVAGMEAVLKTVTWVRDNRGIILAARSAATCQSENIELAAGK